MSRLRPFFKHRRSPLVDSLGNTPLLKKFASVCLMVIELFRTGRVHDSVCAVSINVTIL